MATGTIPAADLPGGLDLQTTLESGQSYHWRREDGGMYEETGARGGDGWYATVVDGAVVRVRQVGGAPDGDLQWEATTDADPILADLLRLDDDLPAIRAATPEDPLVAAAFDAYPGLRVVRDPPFPTLVAFICSAQMRVARIHAMQRALAREYGTSVTFDGRTYHGFPSAEQLAAATEGELRDLGLGYRAPYVVETAEMVADGRSPADARGLAYEDAREALTEFVGVGSKVADCVLLFSLDYLEAVPLDTWIRTAIADHYPDCDRGSYAETSRAIRERFGGEYAGYAQTYVFHHLRTGE